MQVGFALIRFVVATVSITWVEGSLVRRLSSPAGIISSRFLCSYRSAHDKPESTVHVSPTRRPDRFPGAPYITPDKPVDTEDDPELRMKTVRNLVPPDYNIPTNHVMVFRIHAGQTTSIYEVFDKKARKDVTLMVNRILGLQTPMRELQRLDRIQEATQKVRELATAESPYSGDDPIRCVLPDHLDHFSRSVRLTLELWTVLEPMELLPLTQYIISLESLPLVGRERLVAHTIRSMIAAVLHIHRTGYLHGHLDPGNTFIDLRDKETLVVRLLEFQAIPSNDALANIPGEYRRLRNTIRTIVSMALWSYETVSPTLTEFRNVVFDHSAEFESIRSHPFLQQ